MFYKIITTLVRPFFVYASTQNLIVRILIATYFLFYSYKTNAQNYTSIDSAYQNVIRERSVKIVNTLGIINGSQSYKIVQSILMNQYFNLNSVHEKSKLTIAQLKVADSSKATLAASLKLEEEKKSIFLKELHVKFLTDLKKEIAEPQIEQIKDGMTYNILQVTWKAYLDMLQHLTQAQKDKMYAWLVEARELAMDEGSSNSKHAVFGKYKGKINNYLSAEGYNMKQEGDDWAKRIQKAKDEKNAQN